MHLFSSLESFPAYNPLCSVIGIKPFHPRIKSKQNITINILYNHSISLKNLLPVPGDVDTPSVCQRGWTAGEELKGQAAGQRSLQVAGNKLEKLVPLKSTDT